MQDVWYTVCDDFTKDCREVRGSEQGPRWHPLKDPGRVCKWSGRRLLEAVPGLKFRLPAPSMVKWEKNGQLIYKGRGDLAQALQGCHESVRTLVHACSSRKILGNKLTLLLRVQDTVTLEVRVKCVPVPKAAPKAKAKAKGKAKAQPEKPAAPAKKASRKRK